MRKPRRKKKARTRGTFSARPQDPFPWLPLLLLLTILGVAFGLPWRLGSNEVRVEGIALYAPDAATSSPGPGSTPSP